MSLILEGMCIKDFRSYDTFECEMHSGVALVIGPNATGKTNLLEAVQLVAQGESFRNPSWKDVVRWGQDSSSLKGSLSGDKRHLEIECSFGADGVRKRTVNNKKWRRNDSGSGSLQCVVFTPDDLELVKQSARVRRDATDTLGANLSVSYGRLCSDYEKVLRHRNALLKEESSTLHLAVWNERLIAVGGKIHIHRKRLLDRMQRHATQLHSLLAPGEELTMEYRPAWAKDGCEQIEDSVEGMMREHLSKVSQQEVIRGTSLVGPHRDEITFLLDGRDARVFASQGQQRTIALSWKLAEVETVKELGSGDPLLLLDDVMSELDSCRREALLRTMNEVTQTIITSATREYFDEDLLASAHVIELS